MYDPQKIHNPPNMDALTTDTEKLITKAGQTFKILI